MTFSTLLIIAGILLVIAFLWNAIRRATGLVLIVLGIYTISKEMNFILGIPLIFVGGILLLK